MNIQKLLDELRGVVGPRHVSTSEEDKIAYQRDWRGKFQGACLAVVRPATTAEVSEVVRLCSAIGVPIVPQGGNTGLSGGATPDSTGLTVVLSLKRMQAIRNVDLANGTILVEAGCVLQTVQEEASKRDRLFPLSLAAEGSCTIGGNLATNAGGTAVLRYGNARDLCLGLEAVMPDGSVWNGLRGLRKDNTGYDLRALLIGSEGTLGVITAAVLKLYPKPRATSTALVAVPSVAMAVALLELAQSKLGPALTAMELMSDACINACMRHMRQMRFPLESVPKHCVLIELSDFDCQQRADQQMQDLLEFAVEGNLVEDAAISQNLGQAQDFWAMREFIAEALQHEGAQAKHDISVPISALAHFYAEAQEALGHHRTSLLPYVFGHVGDGNLHFNVVWKSQGAGADLEIHQEANHLIHDLVSRFNGSISAEHGLGQLRRSENLRLKPRAEIALMRQIKAAFDPKNVMNPGKMI